jgi:hypothetical protein
MKLPISDNFIFGYPRSLIIYDLLGTMVLIVFLNANNKTPTIPANPMISPIIIAWDIIETPTLVVAETGAHMDYHLRSN